MFQDAASFHLGMVAQLTGYGATLAEDGGSAFEFISRAWDEVRRYYSEFKNHFIPTEIPWLPALSMSDSNNDRNMHSIAAGATYIQSHIHEIAHPLPPMEPVSNEQAITD